MVSLFRPQALRATQSSMVASGDHYGYLVCSLQAPLFHGGRTGLLSYDTHMLPEANARLDSIGNCGYHHWLCFFDLDEVHKPPLRSGSTSTSRSADEQ